MLNITTRRIQVAGALIISTMLIMLVALFGGSSASAQSQPVPVEADVTITKLSQPTTLGEAATGLEQNLEGTGIGGVIFDYYLVPNIDMGTNAGQLAAASITPEILNTLGEKTGSFDETQATSGVTTKTLPRGLYVVKEDPKSVPAGVTAAAPFMLTVPLTDPTDSDKWLDQIYIYPKNSLITATKTVDNAEALTVGSDVTWTITSDIPRVENPATTGPNDQFRAPDYFRIDDTLLDNELVLNPVFTEGDNASIKVTAGGTTLEEGRDYGINEEAVTDPDAGTTYQILFTPAGRDALATAVNTDPDAEVVVTLTTTILSATKIDNSAQVFPNQNSVTQNRPIEIPAVEVRYGGYNILKQSSLETQPASLAGAQFRVYDNKTDALELNDNFLKPATQPSGTWASNVDGQVSITGLRYSNYANGAPVSEGDPNYVIYYLVEIKALDGHQLLAEPVEFVVTENSGITTPWESNHTLLNQATTGAFVLPLTGGTGTTLLTIAGIAILAVVLFVARRRSATEA